MTFLSIMLNTITISMTTSLCFFSFDTVSSLLVNDSYKPDERLKSIINHPRPPQSPLMDRSPAPRKVSSFLSEEKPAVETHWLRRYGRGLEGKKKKVGNTSGYQSAVTSSLVLTYGKDERMLHKICSGGYIRIDGTGWGLTALMKRKSW